MPARKRRPRQTVVYLTILLALVQACQNTPVPPTPTALPVKPTINPTETPTLIPTPTPTPTPVPISWNYVAFGEKSIISEAGANSYATHYASYIAEDLGVNVKVVFYTIEDVLVKDQLDRLRNDQALRDAIRNAHIITIATGDLDIIYPIISAYLWESCGGNDNKECIREALTDFQIQYGSLLEEILNLCSPRTIVRTMTLPTRSLQEIYGSDEDLTPFYRLLNNQITEISYALGIPVTLVHEVFEDSTKSIKNGYLYPHGWSPTEQGAINIALLHRNLGYEPTCP